MASVGCLNSVPGSYRLFKCLRAFSVRSGFHTKPILILNRLYNGASINSTRCSSIFSMTETKYISITSVGLLMRIQSSVVRSRFSTEINANKVKIEGVTEIPTTNEGDSESKKKKEADFSMKAMKYTFISFGLLFSGLTGYLIATWGAPGIDEEGKIIEDAFSKLPWWKAYAMRTWKEINYYDKMIKEPSREKLLPDPLTEPYYQPPYTLVLEMTGVLVHPDWTYKTGWRFKKRPGVDFFLQQVGPPLFEVVIYTAEQGFTAFPILDTLDPNGFIMYRLFRDATRYLKGHHVKDLSCLNRDLSKVIFIDWNDRSFQLQPDNALKLQKWTGNDEDRTLVDLAAFLRTIATSQVEDVRSVLSFYRQYDDPIEAFKVNQKRLQEEQQKLAQQRRTEQGERRLPLTSNWSSWFGKH